MAESPTTTSFSPRAHLLVGLVAPMIVVAGNAWRVWAFTIDDAYISFRYADNLAAGNGLVYNVGERVEGYTNFLWTVLLALARVLGASPESASKVLGAAFACAALIPMYLLERRLRPFTTAPCLSTWLLATSFLYTGYAVFGLETSFFIALTLAGTELYLRESERDDAPGIPWSGFVLGLAALTRPEAPLWIAMLTIWQGKRAFSRPSLLRLGAFVLPVAGHLAWRRVYYGSWLPNTLTAKTGDLGNQLKSGGTYLENYVNHAGPFVWLGLGALAASLLASAGDSARIGKERAGAVLGSVVIVFGFYVALVGGDWMPYFRFLAPAEPFAFLLVGQSMRALFERRERAVTLALGVFSLWLVYHRCQGLFEAQRNIIKNDKGFWDDSAGRTAAWFLQRNEPGPIAIADIGYVGYATNYPIVDMLGLLAPEIARLPGGYTRKVGAGYGDAIFARNPRYFVIISSQRDCKSPSVPSSRTLFADPRFKGFPLAGSIHLKGGGSWCIFGK
jgi:arabinofuranosyltransferase